MRGSGIDSGVGRTWRGLRRAAWLTPLLGALLAAGGSVGAEESGAAQAKAESGVRDFMVVAEVLLSPRCRNCHPAGDIPLNSDMGTLHAMNVSRRSPKAGLDCTACHRSENLQVLNGPPGVPDWHMTSAEMPMIFEGRTAGELCKQLKDPAQTGNRKVEDVVEHMEHDKFVLWAWNPGPGRTTPPVSHGDLMKRVRGWVSAGAPCPP